MTTIERFGANGLGFPENSGPEKYAPRNQRPPEIQGNVDQAAANVSFLYRQRSEVNEANDLPAENLNALIGRIAGMSMDEIDGAIRELESVRDMLRNEGERISRELASYASLSHAATTVMKVITTSIKQWKGTQGGSGQPPAT